MTGDKRGACEVITGTPYVGADQLAAACGADAPAGADTHGGQPESDLHGQASASSPQLVLPNSSASIRSSVTGTSYEDGQSHYRPF